MADPPGRLLVAFGDDLLTWVPDWVALDDEYPNLVTSYSIDRGRQYELDRTDTGRATVEIADTAGILDPTNPSGPFATLLNPLKQVKLCRYNPVADEWDTRFRGFIEELDYAFDPAARVNRLTMTLVDLFEILAAIEMTPATFGHDASGTEIAEDVAGQVWYGPKSGASAPYEWRDGQSMEGRINAILEQALGLTAMADWTVVFSGNVVVQPTTYSSGESPLAAIQETADAEFSGVSNVFVDRFGRLAVHGRLAKFDPEGVVAGAIPGNWIWHEWQAGDGGYVASAPASYAHIREFAFNRGLGKVINSALATPLNIDDDDVSGQYVSDATSIGHYGIRSWSAQNLITKSGTLGLDGEPGFVDGLTETKRVATFYVDNYAEPRNRITQVGFRSIDPSSSGASENWRLMSKVDISDSIEVSIDAPAGGGFEAEPYFVEGVHEQVTALNPAYDNVTVSLDLSPRAYFTGSNPWGPPP